MVKKFGNIWVRSSGTRWARYKSRKIVFSSNTSFTNISPDWTFHASICKIAFQFNASALYMVLWGTNCIAYVLEGCYKSLLIAIFRITLYHVPKHSRYTNSLVWLDGLTLSLCGELRRLICYKSQQYRYCDHFIGLIKIVEI